MLRKTVIITGASGGIGEATAFKFAENGYNLALTYNSHDIDKSKFKKFDVEVQTYKLNISNPKEITKVFEQIFKDFDYVDFLVANAGISEKESLLIEKSDEEIERILNTNLLGCIICNRECLKYFIKNKHGSIVNISSINGQTGSSCNATYSASKAGIIAMTQSLSREVGKLGIRINAIAPGFIMTNMTSSFPAEAVEVCKKNIPLGRVGQGEDIASAVYFLASSEASYITGQVLGVNGGAILFG